MSIWIETQDKTIIAEVIGVRREGLRILSFNTKNINEAFDEHVCLLLGQYKNEEESINVLNQLKKYIDECSFSPGHGRVFSMPQKERTESEIIFDLLKKIYGNEANNLSEEELLSLKRRDNIYCYTCKYARIRECKEPTEKTKIYCTKTDCITNENSFCALWQSEKE